jgi:hypothetical protein
MKPKEVMKQHNESYLTTLKQAHNLTDMRTLGIERKGFIKHALAWAIEKHSQQEAQSKRLAKKDKLLELYSTYHFYVLNGNLELTSKLTEDILKLREELK